MCKTKQKCAEELSTHSIPTILLIRNTLEMSARASLRITNQTGNDI